jgi:hypothetical protein
LSNMRVLGAFACGMRTGELFRLWPVCEHRGMIAMQTAQPGTLTVLHEPLYAGVLDGLPPGASCIAAASKGKRRCGSGALRNPGIGSLHQQP